MRAAPVITFSGGSGSPLSITLNEPITFTLNQSYGESFIYIALDELYPTDQPLQFLSNASSSFTLSGLGYSATANNGPIVGWNGGSSDPRDIVFDFVGAGSLANGAQITLSAGQLVTSGNMTGPLPTAASFSVWLRHNNGGVLTPISNQVSVTNASAIPEPATTTALAGLAVFGALLARRRRAG